MNRILPLLAALGMAGCASIGPSTVTRDRFDYTGAVAESWKSQMLLNLVKLRYGDTPVFLDVGQIVSGYTVQSTFSAGGSIFSTSGVVPGVPNSSVTLGAQGQYTDRPTITYTPLAGERFARSLMTPVPPAALLSLIQAGNPVDLVLRLAVHVVNGIYNRYGGDVRARARGPGVLRPPGAASPDPALGGDRPAGAPDRSRRGRDDDLPGQGGPEPRGGRAGRPAAAGPRSRRRGNSRSCTGPWPPTTRRSRSSAGPSWRS